MGVEALVRLSRGRPRDWSRVLPGEDGGPDVDVGDLRVDRDREGLPRG